MDVELRLVCSECGAVADDQADGWRAHLMCDEPAEAAVFCPDCADREFGGVITID